MSNFLIALGHCINGHLFNYFKQINKNEKRKQTVTVSSSVYFLILFSIGLIGQI